jgi:hypothetical protein
VGVTESNGGVAIKNFFVIFFSGKNSKLFGFVRCLSQNLFLSHSFAAILSNCFKGKNFKFSTFFSSATFVNGKFNLAKDSDRLFPTCMQSCIFYDFFPVLKLPFKQEGLQRILVFNIAMPLIFTIGGWVVNFLFHCNG